MKNLNKEIGSSYLSLFFITITVVLVLKLIFNLLALKFIKKVWDLDTLTVFYDLENGIFDLVYAHKILALFDQLGTFLLPSIVLFLVFKKIKPNFKKPIKKDYIKLILVFIILVGSTQILTFFSIKIGYDFLPQSIQGYLQKQQEFNSNLQDRFIDNSLSSFSFNIILLALIPAIGEELFFRGLIQKIFVGLFKNTFAGILLTSLVFGVLHFQIDNLLAIVFASMLFGYTYEKSDNLFLTIILHFCFNLLALVSMQALKNNIVSELAVDSFGNYIFIPLSVAVGLLVIKKKVFW